MELGMIGLGRMGSNMAQRLLNGGRRVVAYDPSKEALAGVAGLGAVAVGSVEALAKKLTRPRAVWLMAPSGAATEEAIDS
ncbi:MAG: NAD(P)-binding domain-containing protein, partial [Dehalococcoidia bacterium]|nr:NAD(P)-binding domain-containing protein [Dehalococcoidia bacterium]